MEKILDGVYQMTFGEPEKFSFTTFREYPMKPFGGDAPAPFDERDVDFSVSERGCLLSFPQMGEVYGFGLQLRCFKHTLQKRVLRCNADAVTPCGESHAPAPFFVTTAGYGVFVDTARDAAFYCGQAREKGISAHHAAAKSGSAPENTYAAYRGEMNDGRFSRTRVEIPIARGVTVYLFAGETMLEAVQKYVMFSGGGAKLPAWGLGAWYRLYGASVARDWTDMAARFRRDDLPVSVLGLEPGWHTHAYSCSFVFDGERLGDYAGAIQAMKSMGYRVNLWEHCYTHPSSPIYEALFPYAGDQEVWAGLVPDFSIREAREIFQKQQLTLNADCFKLDECDGSDHTGGWSYPDGARFPSGLDGEQMHHLLGLLYQQTINEAFPNACHEVRASGALSAPYPFVLYSDLYDHRDFIRGVVNAGFSGLLWAPEVRHAESLRDFARRMQTALFSPQMLVNAWYLKNPPWDSLNREGNNRGEKMPEAEEALALTRELFKAREKLVPYLEQMYAQYHETGKPVFRALILDYPGDERCLTIDDEYLMGDHYLFAPLTAKSDTRSVYLPGGAWMRGKARYEAGTYEFTCDLREYLLFEKVRDADERQTP